MKLRYANLLCVYLLVAFSMLASIPGLAVSAITPDVNYQTRLTQGLKSPAKVVTDMYNNIYVGDARNGIIKYNHDGNYVATISKKPPKALAVTQSGDLAASYGDYVAVIDGVTGAEKFRLGNGSGQFKQASGVTIDNLGRFYVVDSLDNCVQMFTQTGAPRISTNAQPGKPSNSFGSQGNQAGQFYLPSGISFEKSFEFIAVADTMNGRVQFFTTDGYYAYTVGTKGSGHLQFISPRSVAFEYSKDASPALLRIYIVDSFQSEIQIVDAGTNRTYIGSIGGYGFAEGKLVTPSDIAFLQPSSRLLVANGLGDVSVYGINVTSPPVPDITPPVLTLDQLPSTISINSLTISGTVESDSSISIMTSTGASVSPVTTHDISPVSRFWSATLNNLAVGANVITVIATDSSANTSVIATTVTFSQTAAKVTINPVATPTNVTNQLITGTMDNGATVTLSSSSSATFGQVIYPTTTTWQAQVSSLANGSNVITATADNGTTSSSATAIITVVQTSPDLNVSCLQDGSISSEPVMNISGYIDTGSFFDQLTVNGVIIPVINNLFGTTITLNPGANVIVIQATDKAGNSVSDTRTITYLPQRPVIMINSPADGLTLNALTIAVSGTAPVGSNVSLKLYNGSSNGLQFTQLNQPNSNTNWQTTQSLPLDPGMNTIVATVTDNTGATAETKVTINNDSKVPQLVIETPFRDTAVNQPLLNLSGKTDHNAAVTANINGNDLPVAMDENGNFTLSYNLYEVGTYIVTVTATNAVGNSTTAFRSIIYDLTPPTLTVDSLIPLRVTATGGALIALDRNGPVSGAVITFNPDFSSTIDLSNATYDAASLDIHAIDGAGNSSRNGDMNGSGSVDIIDVVLAMRASVGLDPADYASMLRADVAPLNNGVSRPDGVLDVFDIVFIMERIVGLR